MCLAPCHPVSPGAGDVVLRTPASVEPQEAAGGLPWPDPARGSPRTQWDKQDRGAAPGQPDLPGLSSP